MVLRAKENSMGAWLFLIGIIFAIFIGVFSTLFVTLNETWSTQIYGILVLLGVIIGFKIKVMEQYQKDFLLISAILVVVSKFGMESVIGSVLGVGIGMTVRATFSALLALFVPATLIVAIKYIFSLTRI